jgi:hypothetical protein
MARSFYNAAAGAALIFLARALAGLGANVQRIERNWRRS